MDQPATIIDFLTADLNMEYGCLHCTARRWIEVRSIAFDQPEIVDMTVDEFLAQAVCDNFFCKNVGARLLDTLYHPVMLYGRYCPPDIDHAAWMAADLEQRAILAKWRRPEKQRIDP